MNDIAVHLHVGPGDVCPVCERRVPVPKEDSTPRKRKQVLISVPQDEAENGEEVLLGLEDGCRQKLQQQGLAYDAQTPRYYIYTAVMADFLAAR